MPNYLKLIINCLLVIISLLLIFYPEIDLFIANYVYEKEQGFYLKNHPVALFFHKLVPVLSYIVIATLLVSIIYFFLKKNEYLYKALYLTICMALGPGLIVNTALKENMGRPRPNQIITFGGEKNFMPAWHYSNECKNNCSFVSGHASMGFYFTALSFISPSLRVSGMVIGILLGIIFGIGRIAQGGHFVSDVFFSGLVVILTNIIVYVIFKKKIKNFTS
ncbi:MAG: phosphatase PAP2 family protein [Sphingobacteriia bacterium]|nr:phosphatase PAP2 family protein [Sphingobacteriia bacterium]